MSLQANLQTDYIRRLDVINRGLSGYTSRMGLCALKPFLPFDRAAAWPDLKLVTVFYGANDACIPGELQHVKLESYVEALQGIIAHVSGRSAGVILITPPPVNEHQFQRLPSGTFQRRAGITSQYAQAAEKLARTSGIPCVDLWMLFMKEVGWQEGFQRECCCGRIGVTSPPVQITQQHIPGCFHAPVSFADAEHCLEDFLVDGLHLTQLGYDHLYLELMRVIRLEVPQFAPESLPMVVPSWKEALDMIAQQ